LIEQFLFTEVGERVNRPDFGSGLLQLVFAPNSPELAATLRFTVQAGLQRWLGDIIEVQGLEVISEDSTLRLHLQYQVLRTGDVRQETFEKSTGEKSLSEGSAT
jgi:phage baseplate assembly protein W